ncbi:hypothetical protein GCK72_010986 [Caenorhabditis remanei]|uniref:RRM domain-containing protein n=1 Tax=Caenorhabditis remanei TaxID=31234 RepID=A0A6A5H7G1_CAERE|nr:hypothetical protein GCK72_010986 [Caenorhabditis remanei]KAF1762724.1 hypothetical protein GCK72_010986 [Caenorhabditis remanei]
MSHDSPPEERMIYVGGFAEQVDEEILEELFIQTGPVVKVMIRDIKDSRAKYALIEFEDEATVLFAIELMNGVKLFNKEINVKPRNGTKQEELYRRKRGEIEERFRVMMADLGGGDRERDRDRRSSYDNRRDYQRDRSPHSRDSGGVRDWDRNSRSNR